MRTLLVRYILSEFIEIFLPVFFGLILLSSAYRLTTLSDIEQTYLSFKNTVLIFLYLIPLTVPIILTLSFLFALIIVIVKLRFSGEFIGIFTARISPLRVFSILFFPAFLLTFFCLFNNLYLKPLSAIRLYGLLNKGTVEILQNLKTGEIKRLDENTFIYAGEKKGNFQDVLYYKASVEKDRLIALSAKELILYDRRGFFQCTFNQGTMFSIAGENATIYDFSTLSLNPFKERPFREISPKAIPTKALFFITKFQGESYKEAVELGERLFLPFGIIVLTVFGFSIMVTNKKEGYITSILLALFAAVIHFLLFFLVYNLGKKGIIEPLPIFGAMLFLEMALGLIFFIKKFKGLF